MRGRICEYYKKLTMDLAPWPRYQCPDCRRPLERTGASLKCPGCGRAFQCDRGVWRLLPQQIENSSTKNREKEGWARLSATSLDAVRDYYLALPYVDDAAVQSTHYREAARQFRLLLSYLDPLPGKCGLDLGGSIGWGAWRLAQAGARMLLADYNDDPIAGLGGARIYLEQGPPFERACVDAECLPLADAQFDFVYCCAFLHHLTHPASVVCDVARVLRPGGVFAASMESFRPWWMSAERALARSRRALEFKDDGINEQVFSMGEYRRWFQAADLRLMVVNPRWDEAGPWRIDWNAGLQQPDYEPEILANRRDRAGLTGWLVRRLLARGHWRVLASRTLFPLLRGPLWASTQKYRILIGLKA